MVDIKYINELYFDQAVFDYIDSRQGECDDSELPVLPRNENDPIDPGGENVPEIH